MRNGEILRVGNKSQGYAVAVVDLPVAHNADIAEATELADRVARRAAWPSRTSPRTCWSRPRSLGVEKVGPEGVTLRVTARPRPVSSSPCSARSTPR